MDIRGDRMTGQRLLDGIDERARSAGELNPTV
jgi:hypothetical protein